ncbi:MAG: hypothetical protein BWZ08_00699 [candidate division BRC1 bacterium ADurb.BinA292]|nr:MAG: hypothetical protein BWZ08_00699 [candidate division BRC1 bacterium ADurb.BinA292]
MRAQLVVARRQHARVGGAAQHASGVQRVVALALADNAGEDLLADDEGVGNGLHAAQADVARPAVRPPELLAKVGQQRPVAAAGRLAVVKHRAQRRLRAALGLPRLLLQHALPELVIARGEKQNAVGVEPVAPGPAAFLLVVFQRAGHRGVDHEANVGLVDAHAEGDGGDDDLDAVIDEVLLIAPADVVLQAGMIRGGGDAARAQMVGKLLDLLARQAVDDARLAAVASDELGDLVQEAVAGGARLDAVDQVGPVERTDEDLRRRQAELPRDVVADAVRRRRGIGVDGDRREGLLELAQAAVFGPEIVAPLADAVGFVDGEERDARLAQRVEEAIEQQPLRRDVEDLEPRLAHGGEDGAALIERHRAVEAGRRHAAADQRVDLVLHQRDQRRDDDRHPLHRQRGGLVADRLAAAGGKDDERIAPRQDRLHRLALMRPEAGVAPIARQDLGEMMHTGVSGDAAECRFGGRSRQWPS